VCEEGGHSTGEEGGGSTEQEAAAETATEAQLEGETRVGASLENIFARMRPRRNRRVCDIWKLSLLQHDALSPNVECVSVEFTVVVAITERLEFSKPEHVTFSDKDRIAEFVPAAHRACQWPSAASL
jgi:hypothetical protein